MRARAIPKDPEYSRVYLVSKKKRKGAARANSLHQSGRLALQRARGSWSCRVSFAFNLLFTNSITFRPMAAACELWGYRETQN